MVRRHRARLHIGIVRGWRPVDPRIAKSGAWFILPRHEIVGLGVPVVTIEAPIVAVDFNSKIRPITFASACCITSVIVCP